MTLRLLRHLRERSGLPEEEALDPKVRTFAAKSGLSPKDLAVEKRRFREQLRGLVEAGHPLLLVTTEPDLPGEDLTPLAGAALALPPVSPDLILEVLSRTHAEGFDEAEVRALLPGEAALARLTPVQLAAAFALADATAVAMRLATIAAAGRPVPRVTLDDVLGQPEAVGILRGMAADLAAWRSGRLNWGEVTASALLTGPPGIGKTLAAEALAGTARVPLVATSYSSCQKMGHQGDALAELHARVEEAIGKAPSVFFLDEIDSYEARGGTDHSSKYQRGIVNGLLEQLTRLSLAEGVIVLAATNFPEVVDPAVVRSGRIDLRIAMTLPDRQGLEDLLAAGLERMASTLAIPAEDIAALARRLVGATGADVAALLRDAAGRARAAGRALALADLHAAADRLAPASDPAFERRVALHEAGHLLVGHLAGLPAPRRASLTPLGGFVERPALPVHTLATAEAELATLFAGRAAETLVFGAPSSGAGESAASDLARATRLALGIETAWRLGTGDGGLAWCDPDRPEALLADPALRGRVEARLKAAEAEATRLLAAHLPNLHRLADVLMAERDLGAARLAELLAPFGAARPMHAQADDDGKPAVGNDNCDDPGTDLATTFDHNPPGTDAGSTP